MPVYHATLSLQEAQALGVAQPVPTDYAVLLRITAITTEPLTRATGTAVVGGAHVLTNRHAVDSPGGEPVAGADTLHLDVRVRHPHYDPQRHTATRAHGELERLARYLTARFAERLPPAAPLPPTRYHPLEAYRFAYRRFLFRVFEDPVLAGLAGVRAFLESPFTYHPEEAVAQAQAQAQAQVADAEQRAARGASRGGGSDDESQTLPTAVPPHPHAAPAAAAPPPRSATADGSPAELADGSHARPPTETHGTAALAAPAVPTDAGVNRTSQDPPASAAAALSSSSSSSSPPPLAAAFSTPPAPRMGRAGAVSLESASWVDRHAPALRPRGMLAGFKRTPEIDAFFETAAAQTAAFTSAAQAIVKAMDAADRMAQELARTLMQTGLRFREVTLSPTHDAFPHVLRKTCTGHQTAAQYTRDTSASLQAITGPALAVLLAGCKTTDAALRARFDALTQYDEAVKRTSRRVAAVDKLKTTRAIQATKVDAALERLAAAKQQEGQDRESLRSISVILKARMPTFRERVVCDTAQMLQEIAEVQRQAAQREWRLWQTLYHELDTVC